jgi:hypothetical protein
MELVGVLFLIVGAAFWWHRKRSTQHARDVFLATAEMRHTIANFPNASPMDYVDSVAYKLVLNRPNLSPADARQIAFRAAQHIAVDSRAWSPIVRASTQTADESDEESEERPKTLPYGYAKKLRPDSHQPSGRSTQAPKKQSSPLAWVLIAIGISIIGTIVYEHL